MSVVKIIELVGESEKGWEDALRNLVSEATRTLHGITRVGVKEFDVRMDNDRIEVFRVRAELSFRIER